MVRPRLLAAARRSVLAASRRWWVRAGAALLAAVVVVATLRGRLPDSAEIIGALRDADPRWFAVALVLQQLSQAAFGWQQRVMLSAFGVDLPRRVAMALAYARSAISLAFPAGSAVSAAYAVAQYRRRGAPAAAAATTMVLSGAASVVGLLLTYAGVAGLAHPAAGAVGLLFLLVAASATFWLVHAHSRRRPLGAAPGRAGAEVRLAAASARADAEIRLATTAGRVDAAGQFGPALGDGGRLRGIGRVAEYVRGLVREVRTVRVGHWGGTVLLAVLNWLLDLGCLVAAARGSGLSLSVAHLATVYLAVQVVRQIPITPGGFGVIEASLLAGLVTAGAPHAAAVAAVLVYRLASCWFVLPLGLGSHLILRLRNPRLAPVSAPAVPSM
ncbi:uncharacterized membrane protein YbhN (UPF0104 family) [Actinoplanes tereljensis]|uniref:lysylphosphatidylglycerol synthase transmembrane domain-containing protein n=1 Tax=Paractinoplanes tereljensis TaxID=571912 RepID=UPI001942BA5A|nr:lysylphosphatidylglycerol synthase transmembrane domain-containing protein [Actinoplanes tereljensis]